jgi:hypothetical protein
MRSLSSAMLHPAVYLTLCSTPLGFETVETVQPQLQSCCCCGSECEKRFAGSDSFRVSLTHQYYDQVSHRSRHREPCTTPVSDPPIHPTFALALALALLCEGHPNPPNLVRLARTRPPTGAGRLSWSARHVDRGLFIPLMPGELENWELASWK